MAWRPRISHIYRRRRLKHTARLVPTLLLLGGALWFAAGCDDDPVSGSGRTTTEQRNVSPFTELTVRGAIEAQVRIGQPQSVAITGDENIVRIIKTEVRDDRLTIEPERSHSSDERIRVEIVVPSIEEIDLSGASTMTLSGVDAQDLDLRVSGASTIQVSGSADELDAEASGASRMRLENLSVREADVDVTGASTVDLTVSERITGNASGASTVTYSGDPEVRVRTSGASNVRRR